jgi:eukaryotic-like serine/threonine-protein kinase
MPGDSDQLIGGRYRLAETIGQGGMGIVWHAHDERLDRDVAVKEIVLPVRIPPDEQRLACERSVREARAAGRLDHPGVITIHDVVEHDGRPWIIMELFRGGSLADLIDRAGRLPPRRVAEIGLCVLDALRAAHGAGIVHRDVKPANVLVSGSRVVLTDFGAAAIQSDPALTRSGTFIGTPAYMAPERAQQVRASPDSDLWSLGATLYAAVEGRPPYTGADSLAVLSALLTSDPPPPRHAGTLAPVLIGLMCRNMKQRLSAGQARDLLARAAANGLPPRSPTRTPTEPAAGLRASPSRSASGQPTATSSQPPELGRSTVSRAEAAAPNFEQIPRPAAGRPAALGALPAATRFGRPSPATTVAKARGLSLRAAISAGAILVAAAGLALVTGWVWGIVVLIEKQVAAGGAHSPAPYGLLALLLGIVGLPIVAMIGALVVGLFRRSD